MEHEQQPNNGTKAQALSAKVDYLQSFKEQTAASLSINDLNQAIKKSPTFKEFPTVKDLVSFLNKELSDVLSIYYGIGAGSVTDALLESCIKEIVEKLPDLKAGDIRHAYDRWNYDRDNWKTPTKRELLEPLYGWRNQVVIIENKYKDHVRKIELEQESQQKAEEFKAHSITVYNDCLESLEWTGTLFEAAVIAPEIAKHIDPEIKAELWEQAGAEMYEREEARELEFKKGIKNPFEYFDGVTRKRIYSRLIVIEGIKNGLTL